MTTISCAILDDDSVAGEILAHHIRKDKRLDLQGLYEHPHEALLAFQTHPPQLLFLDIHLPETSGLELFRAMRTPPMVIFTTVSRLHALEAFDLDAADYLVKPFTFERFLQAVSKAIMLLEVRNSGTAKVSPQPLSQNSIGAETQHVVWVKADGKIMKIISADILYIEAEENYVHIVTQTERFMVLQPLKTLEESLPEGMFCRIHRSYLVSLLHATSIEGNMITVGGATLPIGRSYRDALLERIALR